MKITSALSTLVALACLACGSTVDNGPATDASSSGSETGSSDSVGVTLSTTTTMTTGDSMSATSSVTMTTDPTDSDTTVATDTDPSATTGVDTSAGTEATDPTEPTTTDPSGSTTGSDSATTTGGVVDVDYGPCDFSDPENPTCPEGEICLFVNNGPFAGSHWCAVPCDGGNADGCPASPNDTAFVECSGLGGCALDCGDGDCPEGMECHPIGSGDRCVWPAV